MPSIPHTLFDATVATSDAEVTSKCQRANIVAQIITELVEAPNGRFRKPTLLCSLVL